MQHGVDGSASSSEDELDKLTRSFEEQASHDLQQVAEASRKATVQGKKQKSMKEARETGLQEPISEQSKGYKLLAKMGYEKGRGLGRNQAGRVEPLELLVKEKRTGLGIDEDRKRKQEEAIQNQTVREAKRRQLGDMMQQTFAHVQASRLADRRYEGQLKSARKVIETLDRRKGFEQSFLWPLPEPDEPQAEEVVAEEPVTGEQEAAEPTWEDQPVRDKLVAVLTYLRSQHNYCLHCGCKYDSPEDLAHSCPGLMDEDH